MRRIPLNFVYDVQADGVSTWLIDSSIHDPSRVTTIVADHDEDRVATAMRAFLRMDLDGLVVQLNVRPSAGLITLIRSAVEVGIVVHIVDAAPADAQALDLALAAGGIRGASGETFLSGTPTGTLPLRLVAHGAQQDEAVLLVSRP